MLDQLQIDQLQRGSEPQRCITLAEYRLWQRGYIFDNMRNLRYGQSFCNHFEISDNILYYDALTQVDADRYIRETYVK